jgi:hypothetical protein
MSGIRAVWCAVIAAAVALTACAPAGPGARTPSPSPTAPPSATTATAPPTPRSSATPSTTTSTPSYFRRHPDAVDNRTSVDDPDAAPAIPSPDDEAHPLAVDPEPPGCAALGLHRDREVPRR